MELTRLITRLDAALGSSGPVHAANTVLNLTERALGRQHLSSRPLTVQVEVTSRCNLNCTICSRSSTPFAGKDMPDDLLDPVIELTSRSREMVLFGYGEPLICTTFDRLLERARSARVSFVTNGLSLSRQRAKEILAKTRRPIQTISFSIDSTDPDTYHSIRKRSDFNRVWGNLVDLIQLTAGSRHPGVWIDFVAMKQNVAGLPALLEKAAEAGVGRVNVFNVVVWDESDIDESLINHKQLARDVFARAEAVATASGVTVDLPVVPGMPAEPSATPRPCLDPWSYAYIRQDGTVQACCFADEFAMGNLREEPFGAIWNGHAYRELRATVNSDHPPAPCRRCEQRWRTANSDDDSSVYMKMKPRSRVSGV